MVHRRLVYIYMLNVPSFSCRYFNKIKRTSRLGRLHALSLEILQLDMLNLRDGIMKTQLVIFNFTPYTRDATFLFTSQIRNNLTRRVR